MFPLSGAVHIAAEPHLHNTLREFDRRIVGGSTAGNRVRFREKARGPR